MRIVFDVDDVIVPFTEEICKRAEEKFGKKFPYEDVVWGFKTWQPEEIEFAESLFNDPEFISNLPIRPGFKELIDEITDMGHEVLFCTSTYSTVMTNRALWLISQFEAIHPRNIIITGRKDLIECDISIDDCPNHFLNGRAKIPVAFTTPWNKDVHNMVRASTPEEIKTIVEYADWGYDKNEILQMQQPHYTGEKPCCIVLVGPSASGKTTIAEKMIEMYPDKFAKVISDTTREPRKGEKNGVNYHFRSESEFGRNVINGHYLEYSTYAGTQYGTSYESLESVFAAGKCPVIVMDINGVKAIKDKYPDRSVSFFIKRETEELIKSILLRDVSNEERINRILQLHKDFESQHKCDYCIDNFEAVEDSVQQIVDVIS